MKRIGFDADGVLVNSRGPAWRAAEKLLAIFGTNVQISSQAEFERHFGAVALDALVGDDQANVLRMAHRLALRHAAPNLPVFTDTLAVVGRQPWPCVVVTAALAQGIKTALGTHAGLFESVFGFEGGRKPGLLAALADSIVVYVTDTVADCRMCEAVGIPAVAVTWGYDTFADLEAARPYAIVHNAADLSAALSHFTQKEEQHHE